MAASDFIMNTSNVNAYEKAELTLYFADETGSFLVPEAAGSGAQHQYIHGPAHCGTADRRPSQEGNFATLPSDCKILSLSVTDNVCYINFDGAFLNTTLPVSEYIPIYSIVNSLCETGSGHAGADHGEWFPGCDVPECGVFKYNLERNQEYIKQ